MVHECLAATGRASPPRPARGLRLILSAIYARLAYAAFIVNRDHLWLTLQAPFTGSPAGGAGPDLAGRNTCSTRPPLTVPPAGTAIGTVDLPPDAFASRVAQRSLCWLSVSIREPQFDVRSAAVRTLRLGSARRRPGRRSGRPACRPAIQRRRSARRQRSTGRTRSSERTGWSA